jgi:hypothetical protein
MFTIKFGFIYLLLQLLPPSPAAAFDQPLPPNPQNVPIENPGKSSMRAWSCHGHNQRSMVDRMMQANIVKTPQVRDVLYQVDRQHYMPTNPYNDAPQPIGLGQTISAPHMHAHVLEMIYPFLVKVPPDQEIKILDVGCGSGYLTAALGRWLHNRDNYDDLEGLEELYQTPLGWRFS